jgi:hypothetical protein
MKQGGLWDRVMLFVPRRTGVKVDNVCPNGKFDAKLIPVQGIVVVLSDSPAHLAGGYADDRIVVAVVVRSPAEEFAPEHSFFETIFLSVEGFLNDMAKEWCVSLALSEERARQHPLQLIDDQRAFLRARRHSSNHGIFGRRHRSGFF